LQPFAFPAGQDIPFQKNTSLCFFVFRFRFFGVEIAPFFLADAGVKNQKSTLSSFSAANKLKQISGFLPSDGRQTRLVTSLSHGQR
jgi:hypothetical protein